MKTFLLFLHNTLHAGVMQITPKLIFHQIINVYPHINFTVRFRVDPNPNPNNTQRVTNYLFCA